MPARITTASLCYVALEGGQPAVKAVHVALRLGNMQRLHRLAAPAVQALLQARAPHAHGHAHAGACHRAQGFLEWETRNPL